MIADVDEIIKLSGKEPGQFWKIPVLFEDDHILALEKPADLPAQYDPFLSQENEPNLLELLHAGITQKKPWAQEHKLKYLKNPYAMDPDTSGVFLLAKTKEVMTSLANMVSIETPMLTYLTLIHGELPEHSFEISGRLGPHKDKPGYMQLNRPGGKHSVTRFEWVESIGPYGLVHCQPLTHRRHQIQVHLQHRRLRVCGDPLYAGMRIMLSKLKPGYSPRKDREERPLMNRTALHAEYIELKHPVTGEPLRIESPLPKDFEVTLKYLRQYVGFGGNQG